MQIVRQPVDDRTLREPGELLDQRSAKTSASRCTSEYALKHAGDVGQRLAAVEAGVLRASGTRCRRRAGWRPPRNCFAFAATAFRRPASARGPAAGGDDRRVSCRSLRLAEIDQDLLDVVRGDVEQRGQMSPRPFGRHCAAPRRLCARRRSGPGSSGWRPSVRLEVPVGGTADQFSSAISRNDFGQHVAARVDLFLA